MIINLNGQQQEAIKLSQLEDLIHKHIEKQPKIESGGKSAGKGKKNGTPEKTLNKFLLNVFKNVSGKSNIKLSF